MQKALLIKALSLVIIANFSIVTGCNNEPISTSAQKSVPVEQWSCTYGSQGDEVGHSVKQANDGGYIVVGKASLNDQAKSDIYLLKTDEKGQVQWTRTFTSQDEMIGRSILQTSDGKYIIVGYTHSYTGVETSVYEATSMVYMMKVDENGYEQWHHNYAFNSQETNFGWSVQQTIDEGYIIVGTTGGVYTEETDVYLIKTDSNGKEEWSGTYGGERSDLGYDVKQTNDGGYIVTGRTYYERISPYAEMSAVYLLKTDSNGNEEWSRTFGQDQNAGYSVQQTQDGGYIVVGFTGSLFEESDVFLIKTDKEGQELWTRTFADQGNNQGYSVKQTNDGGYIIVGYTGSVSPLGSTAVYLIKTDRNGKEQWSKVFSGRGTSCGNFVQQTSDKGYIIVGYTTLSNREQIDLYLIKTDDKGDN